MGDGWSRSVCVCVCDRGGQRERDAGAKGAEHGDPKRKGKKLKKKNQNLEDEKKNKAVQI